MKTKLSLAWSSFALAATLAFQGNAQAATIYACKLKSVGTVRIVSANTNCSSYETKISWNTEGPEGVAGPVGATGAQGPVGAMGAQGAVGAMRTEGAVGAMGPSGPTGSAGVGAINCGAEGDIAVAYQGVWTCKSDLPRYVDNGDGTVTDNQTALMWEEKTGTIGGAANRADPHDMNDTYTWSVDSNIGVPVTEPTGTLYTDFLTKLNDLDLLNVNDNPHVTSCFSGPCDRRIPTINELRSITLGPFPCDTIPCVAAGFPAPTLASSYWSSSTVAVYINTAWNLNFNNGAFSINSKSFPFPARAVRSVR